MKTKLFLIVLALGVVFSTSCKKESEDIAVNTGQAKVFIKQPTTPTLTNTQLNAISAQSKTLAAKFKLLSNTASVVAGAKAKFSTLFSDIKDGKFTLKSATVINEDDTWSGPDASGYYYRSWDGVYTVTEKIRLQEGILSHIYSTEYEGGDGSYSNVIEIEYENYAGENDDLCIGFIDWRIGSSGYNDISDVHTRFEFDDWNPETGAGVFDLYWGARSSGGESESYQRILNIIATPGNGEGTETSRPLHLRITFYGDGASGQSFDIDIYWQPMGMPAIPDFPGNQEYKEVV